MYDMKVSLEVYQYVDNFLILTIFYAFHRDVDDNGQSGPPFKFDFTQHVPASTAPPPAGLQHILPGTSSGGASNVVLQQQPSQPVQPQMPPPPPPPPVQQEGAIGGPTGPYKTWADFSQGKKTDPAASTSAGSTGASASMGGAGALATLGATASSAPLGPTAAIVMPPRFLSQSTR